MLPDRDVPGAREEIAPVAGIATFAGAETIEATFPISPTQRDMLVYSLSSPGSGAYMQQAICDLHEHLEPSLLERAWRSVVERHAILRTAF